MSAVSKWQLATNKCRFANLRRQVPLVPYTPALKQVCAQLPTYPRDYVLALHQLITVADPLLAHHWHMGAPMFVMVTMPITLPTLPVLPYGYVPQSTFIHQVTCYLQRCYQLAPARVRPVLQALLNGGDSNVTL